jgi:hypothetical protein
MDQQITTHLFDELIQHIKSAPWFTEDWDIYRDGNYIHIFKKTWHEKNHNGVHFETYIGDSQLENGSFPIVLHAEKDVPNRDAFVQRVIMEIRSQEGFEIGVNDYTILRKEVDLQKETFVADVLKTLKEMQFIVAFVDQHLELD